MVLDKVLGTFTGVKINKIRWKPEELIESSYYISGSWGDEDNELSVWHYSDHDSEVRPTQSSIVPHDGDVTELQFISNNSFVASSSRGSVKLFRLDTKDKQSPKLTETHFWDKLHYFSNGEKSSCTGLACFEEDFVTVGEDGRIVLLTAKRPTPTRVMQEADSCSIRCVCFLKHNAILTGNLRGQMNIWDPKSSSTKAVSNFSLSGGDHIGASCMAQHPSQRHMLVAGGEDGSLTVWDLRHNTFPVTLLSAHSAEVNEVKFHPDRPEHLFTCSASGQLWHWNSSSMARSSLTSSISDRPQDENPWLSSDTAKHRLEVFTLMPRLHLPINSLDVNKLQVLCGCDNEAMYHIKHIDHL